MRLGDDADARVHAGLQAVLVVGNLDFNRRGARGRIEHRRDARDAPHEALAREGVDLDPRHVADANLLQILFDDVGDHAHALNVDDLDDRRVRRDVRARIHRAPRDEPVDRREDHGVLEREPQLVEARLRLRILCARQVERRLCRLILRFRIVERLLRQQLALEEVPRALDVGLGEIQIGFALADGRLADLERRFGLLDLFANLLVLDARDALATADPIAELDADLLQASGGLWHDRDRLIANQVADDGELTIDWRVHDGRELHGELTAAAAGARTAWRVTAPSGSAATPACRRLLRIGRLRRAVPAEHAGVERDAGDCGRDDDRNDDDFSHR